MYCIQRFRRHTEYIPYVWTPTLKIYCAVVLLRSHITAVSPTVEHQSASVTSLTNLNALSSVREGLKIFHYFLKLCRHKIAYATYNETPLKHCDDKKMNPSFLVHPGILPTSMETFMRTCCSAQNPDVRSFSDFSFRVSHNKIPSH